MFNAIEKLSYLSRKAKEDKSLRFKDLYKTIRRTEFLMYAYAQIEANKGSKTPGVDGVTKVSLKDDEKRMDIIQSISNKLKDEDYTPLPVRRVQIPKGFGKKGTRPLGIPAITDRIVQSACKLILEAIFENDFSTKSHGFRPKRSCQTAIEDIIWNKYDWVIEGDIKGCFDNIKHGKLLNILRKRIADEKFINLINKFLKSGYQMGYDEDGKLPVFETKNGTPQGGIVSPVLANIYLNEFDKFIEPLMKTKNKEQMVRGKAYTFWTNKITRLEKAIEANNYPYKILLEYTEKERKEHIRIAHNQIEIIKILEEMNEARSKIHSKKQRSLYNQHQKKAKDIRNILDDPTTTYPVELWVSIADPRGKEIKVNNREEAIKWVKQMRKERDKETWEDDETMLNNKTLGYVRYADDFVILMGGYKKNEVADFKTKISQWFNKELDLTLSEDKTKITHATKGFKFLGYDIKVLVGEKGRYLRPARVYVPKVAFDKVKLKIESVLQDMHNDSPTDLFIALNSVTNGWGNYYRICNNWSSTKRNLSHWLHWQVAHWLGRKHKTTIPKVFKQYVVKVERNGHNYKTYQTVTEKKKTTMWNFSPIDYETPADVANSIRNDVATEIWYKTSMDPTADKLIAIVHKGSSFEVRIRLLEEANRRCQTCGERKDKLIEHHTRLIKRNKRKNSLAVRQASRDIKSVLICEECHKKTHPSFREIKTI